ncbi:heterokaryon incompatibility protein-domain-containing protein [Stachybotrys elegans]|uniref:Heterokaryon incompatibility protein-domain-containing protein n=1 Tax=Stachybotrys elegans TaxID=80388 RepID=A0A8K0T4I8_9HYPO|nr:heterokaryon incompatibility protein-domain-containing protein [Stachybotrys elegans]
MEDIHQDTGYTSLCANCRQIGLSRVFDLTAPELQKNRMRGYIISDLHLPSYSDHTKCLLCRFFTTIQSSSQTGSLKTLHLRAYSAFMKSASTPLRRLPKEYQSKSTLRSQPGMKFIFCIQKSEQPQRIFHPGVLGPGVDYTSITASLNYCRSNHTYLCSKKEDATTPLKLIDCHAPQGDDVVYALPHMPYVALSYVWGHQTIQPVATRTRSRRGSSRPKTISDAQIVVRKLGYRYLWADQLCIDQNDPQEKDAQINLMEQIYNGAELTIVAAAGADSNYGLPGVSTTTRQTMPSVELSTDIQLICIPPHPHHIIKSSQWFTRAWTYQEALLSRRLLVFTDYEVYFECHAMQVRECLEWNYKDLHCKQGKRKLYSALNNGLFLKGISQKDSYISGSLRSYLRFYTLVEEYTARKMRNQEDSLRAFTGIMKHLEGSKAPIFQLYGSACKSLLASLLWAHKMGFRSNSPLRRDEFPSWSWAGWEGQASLRGLFLMNNSIRMIFTSSYPQCRVISKIHPPKRPPHHAQPRRPQPSRAKWKSQKWKWHPGSKGTLYINEGPLTLTQLWAFFTSRRYKLLLIGNLRTGRASTDKVLKPHNNSYYRVGVLEVREDFQQFRKFVRLRENSITLL